MLLWVKAEIKKNIYNIVSCVGGYLATESLLSTKYFKTKSKPKEICLSTVEDVNGLDPRINMNYWYFKWMDIFDFSFFESLQALLFDGRIQRSKIITKGIENE